MEVHILSTFMTAFSMNALDDTPSTDIFTEESTESDSATRRRILLSAIQRVLGEHIDLSINGEKNSDHDRDYVLLYAREVLTLGLFYKEFHDAIREGDGERIITCWRYLLLLFKVSHRTNYSVEAFTLLAQYHFTVSERMQKQLVWSRTVNIHGRTGENVPCDLHMEHLNHECKESISGLGSNITDTSIHLGLVQQSGYHTRKSSCADINVISMLYLPVSKCKTIIDD